MDEPDGLGYDADPEFFGRRLWIAIDVQGRVPGSEQAGAFEALSLAGELQGAMLMSYMEAVCRAVGVSAANTTCSGAPFQGTSGEGRNARSAASLQAAGETSARECVAERERTGNARASGSNAVAAATARRRAGNN